MGESDNHIDTVEPSTPMKDYSWRIMEGSNSDEDGFGGNSQSRQGAGTGTIVPRNRVFGGGGAQMRLWRKPSMFSCF